MGLGLNSNYTGTSLAVQWLRLCVSTAGGVGSTPGRGTKISHAGQRDQKKKKKNSNYTDCYMQVK